MAKDTITFESEYMQEYAKILENAQTLIDEARASLRRANRFDGWRCPERRQINDRLSELSTKLDRNSSGTKETSSALARGAGQFADLETRAQKEETSLYNELKKKWAFERVVPWERPGPPRPPIDRPRPEDLPVYSLPPRWPPLLWIRPPKHWHWSPIIDPSPPDQDIIDDIVSTDTDPESEDTPRRKRIRHLMRLISSVLNRMLGRRGGGSAGPGEGISPDDPVVGINEPVYRDHRHRGPGDRKDSFSELLELIRAFFGGDGSMGSAGGTGGIPGGSSSIANDSALGNNFGRPGERFGSGRDGSQSMNPFMQLLFALIFSMLRSIPFQDGAGDMDQML